MYSSPIWLRAVNTLSKAIYIDIHCTQAELLCISARIYNQWKYCIPTTGEQYTCITRAHLVAMFLIWKPLLLVQTINSHQVTILLVTVILRTTVITASTPLFPAVLEIDVHLISYLNEEHVDDLCVCVCMCAHILELCSIATGCYEVWKGYRKYTFWIYKNQAGSVMHGVGT